MLTSENLETVSPWVRAVVSSLICFHTKRLVCFLVLSGDSFGSPDRTLSLLSAAAGAPANRRGRGGGHRGRGRFNVRRDGPMKFEKDFDFESANAQFNKEEIDREFQDKLKLKGAHSVNSFYGWWEENSLTKLKRLSRKTRDLTLLLPQIKRLRSPRKL